MGKASKTKPLSQDIPIEKKWDLKQAEEALNIEKEYNKRYKIHSVIIKFPDPELNKEMVTKFHQAIEKVHFQQPSTPRICHVTLKESADANTVINAINGKQFGNGSLMAEYKRDREDNQPIGPGDIDPLTLYLGNLGEEITKEVMMKTYPKCRQIEIAFAKKMKYTRYAFINFQSITDSIAAFKKTRDTELYSKSLIIRFRRLHGAVGMPGDSKQQNPPKSKHEPNTSGDVTITPDEYYCRQAEDSMTNSCSVPDVSISADLNTDNISNADHPLVKKEPTSDEEDIKPDINPAYESPFVPGPIYSKYVLPIMETKIKTEIKTEQDTFNMYSNSVNNTHRWPSEREEFYF